jgi:hypothetical protein
LRNNTKIQLQQCKDIIGFNSAAINYLKRNIELSTNKDFFETSIQQHRNKKKKQIK